MDFGVWIPNCRHLATPNIIRCSVIEFLAADGAELQAQMVTFAERVRPRVA
jgi:hypothetical protein